MRCGRPEHSILLVSFPDDYPVYCWSHSQTTHYIVGLIPRLPSILLVSFPDYPVYCRSHSQTTHYIVGLIPRLPSILLVSFPDYPVYCWSHSQTTQYGSDLVWKIVILAHHCTHLALFPGLPHFSLPILAFIHRRALLQMEKIKLGKSWNEANTDQSEYCNIWPCTWVQFSYWSLTES